MRTTEIVIVSNITSASVFLYFYFIFSSSLESGSIQHPFAVIAGCVSRQRCFGSFLLLCFSAFSQRTTLCGLSLQFPKASFDCLHAWTLCQCIFLCLAVLANLYFYRESFTFLATRFHPCCCILPLGRFASSLCDVQTIGDHSQASRFC